MKTLNLILLILSLLLIFSIDIQAQYGKGYEGPDDPAGDKEAERTGVMNGNNVYLFFRNTKTLRQSQ